MNPILARQLAADYCCTPEEVQDRENHFTLYRYLEGRRRFQENAECRLKIAVINGKLLFTGAQEMIDWCRNEYAKTGSEWFFEAKNLRRLNDRLHQDGYQIEMVHPFYIAEQKAGKSAFLGIDPVLASASAKNLEIRWYEKEEIGQFRGDARFDEAYAFDKDAPDVLGVSAIRDGQILGMAGASCDSPDLWQIGINVDPQCREAGIGTLLVTLLKEEVLRRGHLPYYGTSMSHIASQRVALGAGFRPAWAELVTSKL